MLPAAALSRARCSAKAQQILRLMQGRRLVEILRIACEGIDKLLLVEQVARAQRLCRDWMAHEQVMETGEHKAGIDQKIS